MPCRPTAWSATGRSRTLRDAGLMPVFQAIYEDTEAHWDAYHLCEQLVDVEVNFQLWRFRHMKTVERIIGFKRGTGGSSGVGFLKQALELTFFPELFEVRTVLGAAGLILRRSMPFMFDGSARSGYMLRASRSPPQGRGPIRAIHPIHLFREKPHERCRRHAPDRGCNSRVQAGAWAIPRPLWMLFMTEFWERFAFYGIRWALVLYIVAQFHAGSATGETVGQPDLRRLPGAGLCRRRSSAATSPTRCSATSARSCWAR